MCHDALLAFFFHDSVTGVRDGARFAALLTANTGPGRGRWESIAVNTAVSFPIVRHHFRFWFFFKPSMSSTSRAAWSTCRCRVAESESVAESG